MQIIQLFLNCNNILTVVTLLQLQTFIEESVEFITLKIQPTLACSQPHPPLLRDKPIPTGKVSHTQGVTKRCRLSLLTNSALVYEPKCGGGGGRGYLRGLSQ
jgi:hypothetical protein